MEAEAAMNPLSIPAHFDGERILLDAPVTLAPNTKLLVVVVPDDEQEEREFFLQLSQQGLARAYGDDEPEYTDDMLKEINPEYEGR